MENNKMDQFFKSALSRGAALECLSMNNCSSYIDA
jgi:hypothetical protein